MKEIKFFSNSKEGLRGSDFENQKDYSVIINLNFVLSMSQIITFELPFSGKVVGKYAYITMSNNDVYFIKPEQHEILTHIFK